MLEVGSQAIDFSLPDQDGKIHQLSDYRGKKVILYFYPKDNTSGCSKQACNFRDIYPQISEANAVVLGISKDGIKSHKKFSENYSLPFTILSDEQLEVIKQYGVWIKKSMYGREYMGVNRSTFLIDEKGIIVKVVNKANPNTNPQEMLEML